MSNAFDSSNYPTTEPLTLNVGDRWAWRRTDLSCYGSGFTLSYSARLDSDGNTTFTFDGTWDGTQYVIEVASATTAAYTAGTYKVEIYITRDSDSERISIGEQTWCVEPNLATSTADTRTHVKKVLDSIEAVIEGRASKDQESYSIAGRSLSRTPITDLLVLRDKYKALYNQETDAEKMAQGLGSSKKILSRFGTI